MDSENYLLSLISDIIENIGTKKVFTKLDLRWGYNNVRIKERDEWKAVFTTLGGSFELTVMFFGLMNFLTIFHTIINKLLRNLINTVKVGSFINNIMVVTESKKEHDELIEEILRRMKENSLYVKPEKCK